jgi:hypothetical chaperone protein
LRRFGLDFGTSNTSLAYAAGESAPVLLPLDSVASDPIVLRTLLYYSPTLRAFVVGQRAIDEYLAEQMHGTLVQSIKTFLADDSFEETWIHGRAWTLEDLLAVVFRHVRSVIAADGATDDVTLVVGRPAVFVERPEKEELARGRMLGGARRAGFLDVRFEYEPIAAGLAYEASLARPEIALIADLGGGTSDFTVMRLGSGRGRDRRDDILATGGVQVGGDTLDARIMAGKLTRYFGAGTTYRSMEGRDLPFPSHILTQLGRWHQAAFLRGRKTRDLLSRLRWQGSDPGAVDRLETLIDGNLAFFLFQEIERTKTRLSSDDEATLTFHRAGIDIEETLTRAEFENLIARDVAEIETCLASVLSRAGIGDADVASVFLTGGTAQIPALRRLFARRFGEDRLRAQDYLTTVASGLARA